MQEKLQLPELQLPNISSCTTTKDAFNLISSLSAEDVIQQDSTGATILHHLCFSHKIAPIKFDRKVIMEKIIEKNPSIVNLKWNDLDNPIQLAIKQDDVEAVAILVPYYSSIIIHERHIVADDNGEIVKEEIIDMFPVSFALRHAQLDMVNCLYTAGFGFVEGMNMSKYCLDYPKKENLEDLYIDLLLAGKKEELKGLHEYLGYYKGYRGQSSEELVDALYNQNESEAFKLISQGHYIYNDRVSSLFLSSCGKAIDFIFLRTLAHPNYSTRIIDQDKNCKTLLRFTITYSHLTLAIKLIEAGADVNTTNNCKYTLLHQAIRNHSGTLVEKLLKLGADIDMADENQQTAIHLAARFGNDAILKQILDHGADVNKPTNYFKDTPLHLAAEEGAIYTVRMLLQRSEIDVYLKNRNGETALDVAKNNLIKELISEHMKAKTEQTRLLATASNTNTAAASHSTTAATVTPTKEGAFSLSALLAPTKGNKTKLYLPDDNSLGKQ